MAISVNYSNARAQATKLEQAANRCDGVISKLNQSLSIVSSNWSGAAADEYYMNIQKQIKEVKQIRDNCRSIAKVIREVVWQLEEAERRAKAAAEAARIAAEQASKG